MLRGVCRPPSTKCKIKNHHLPDKWPKDFFVQNLLEWAGYDLITASGGSENTVCRCVLHSRTCNTLWEGLSGVVQLAVTYSCWGQPLSMPGHVLPLHPETLLFPSGMPLTPPPTLPCFQQHVALLLRDKLVTHYLAWQSYHYD